MATIKNKDGYGGIQCSELMDPGLIEPWIRHDCWETEVFLTVPVTRDEYGRYHMSNVDPLLQQMKVMFADMDIPQTHTAEDKLTRRLARKIAAVGRSIRGWMIWRILR